MKGYRSHFFQSALQLNKLCILAIGISACGGSDSPATSTPSTQQNVAPATTTSTDPNNTTGTQQTVTFACDPRTSTRFNCSFTAGKIVSVAFLKQLSRHTCGGTAGQGTDWGADPSTNTIWVDHDCRAQFTVTYTSN